MSPIKGISDKVLLPRLGKIRLGIKDAAADGGVEPTQTDYFVCPPEVRQAFGEKPKQLEIMFPDEDSDQWASQYLRRYSDSLKLLCRGDGEKAVANYLCQGTTHLREISCNPLACEHYQSGDCRRVMNLQFLLPDCPGFGVYQLDTGSFYSIRNINSALAFIRGVAPRVSMLPLTLELVEKEVQPDGWPKTAYILNLTWKNSLVDLQRYAEVPPGRALLVPAPDSEAPDDLSLPRAPQEETSQVSDADLPDLWAKAKSKIWHYEIQDYQLRKWFEKNFNITVGLEDFDPPVPPEKFTPAMLARFCESIERYCKLQ